MVFLYLVNSCVQVIAKKKKRHYTIFLLNLKGKKPSYYNTACNLQELRLYIDARESHCLPLCEHA